MTELSITTSCATQINYTSLVYLGATRPARSCAAPNHSTQHSPLIPGTVHSGTCAARSPLSQVLPRSAAPPIPPCRRSPAQPIPSILPLLLCAADPARRSCLSCRGSVADPRHQSSPSCRSSPDPARPTAAHPRCQSRSPHRRSRPSCRRSPAPPILLPALPIPLILLLLPRAMSISPMLQPLGSPILSPLAPLMPSPWASHCPSQAIHFANTAPILPSLPNSEPAIPRRPCQTDHPSHFEHADHLCIQNFASEQLLLPPHSLPILPVMRNLKTKVRFRKLFTLLLFLIIRCLRKGLSCYWIII